MSLLARWDDSEKAAGGAEKREGKGGEREREVPTPPPSAFFFICTFKHAKAARPNHPWHPAPPTPTPTHPRFNQVARSLAEAFIDWLLAVVGRAKCNPI